MVGLTPHERELAEQSVLGLGSGMWNAAKINIAPSGLVEFDTFRNESQNQYINLNEQNTLTDAIENIRAEVLEDVKNSTALQNLLAKPEWSYEDRSAWERDLSKIVSERHDEIIGLDTYRTEAVRVNDLGEISPDLNSVGNINFQYDCEGMSSVEGIILTQVEEALLSDTPANDQDYKINGAYVAASGGVKYSIAQEAGGHAFIISSLTGNIIEGTADPDKGGLPYADTGDDYSYADYIAGELATTQSVDFVPGDESRMAFSIAVYGSYHGHSDQTVIDQRHALIKDGKFDALNDATFGKDSDVDNEQYFKDAFYRQGDVTFTVQKPIIESSEELIENDEHIFAIANPEYSNYSGYSSSEFSLEDTIEDLEDLSTTSYDELFFNSIYNVLEENDFIENGKPAILITEEGQSFLFHKDPEGHVGVYDVTEEDIPNVPTLDFATIEPEPEPQPEPEPEPEPEPQPEPEPEQIEVCPQLHNTSFYELVDGAGILNDTSGYNDAQALRDLVEAAKDLGLSKNVYGHIEEAMDKSKFLETATAIDAIQASNSVLEKAKADGLSAVDTEKAVLTKFFESVTEESLIIDTEGFDDKTPYSKEALEKVREIAKEMDSDFSGATECQVSELQGNFTGAVMFDSIHNKPDENKPEHNVTAPELTQVP